MDKWENGATGATRMNDIASGAAGAATGEMSGATGASATIPQTSEWSVEVDESGDLSRTRRLAVIAGSVSLATLALAGGVTWFVLARRQVSAKRRLEAAVAASRLLRMTPSVARPDMLEATEAVGSATQHAQLTAAEAARMARALARAANLSGNAARDYAAGRVSLAEDALLNAYLAAREGATEAWEGVTEGITRGVARSSKVAQFQPQWLMRAFNAGRYAGRIEQRMK